MTNIIDGPGRQEVPDVVGSEVRGNNVIVDGRVIPKMMCRERGDEIEFIVDGRFSFQFPKQWSFLAAAMASQCMAIGMGYSHMGASNKERPFAPQSATIDVSK